MGRSSLRPRELLLSIGIYRTLSRVESYLLRDRLLLRTGRNGQELIRQAREAPPDAIVIEHLLPDISAVKICAALGPVAGRGRRPLILVVGPARPAEIAVRCRASGCDRYIAARRSPARILEEVAAALRLRSRRHIRFPAVFPVAVGRVSSEFLGYARDISEGGVLVESSLQLARGRRVRLRLFLEPGASPLIVDAVVRRAAAGVDEDQHRIGLEMLDMDRAADTRLMNYLESPARD